MWNSRLTWQRTDAESVFDLDEPRGEALRGLALTTAVLGWLLGIIDLTVNGSSPPSVPGFLTSAGLIGVAALCYSLVRRWMTLAAMTLAAGLTVALGAAVARDPQGQAGYLLALVVVAASAIAGARQGFIWAAVASVVLVFAAHRPGSPLGTGTVVALLLTWGSAVVAWLAFRPVHLAAEWAWHSYEEALRLSQELRARQGELVRLSKSLNEACDRLEQQNEVLERARATAEEARRLKSEFAAAISHELRTPVNLVVGVSEMMMQSIAEGFGGQTPEQCREDVEVIYRNACHISNLIDDILDLSQIDAHRMGLEKTEIRIEEVIEQAIAALATRFERKGLYLRTSLPAALPMVWADPTRLRQVLTNLLSNATRFTDRGGVTVSATPGEREVVVTVADTGVGIPPEELPYVFEEFRQVGPEKGRRGGSGLGLAVSKRLIELHGGNMWVESVVGRGSAFHLSLPLASTVAAVPTSTDTQMFARTATAGQPTLAVLGNDEQAAHVIQRYLDHYRVVPVATSQEALGLARDGRLSALLVTTDSPRRPHAHAPELAGIPVAHCALRTRRTLAQDLGVAAYLVKPVSTEQLQTALRRLHRRIRSVLVVEDDSEMRQMLARMVRSGRVPREVRVAADGREALQLIHERPPDVVLLDLLMPEMDGQQFLAALRAEERLRDLPVIVISAKGYDAESVTAGELSITRDGGFTVGEATRALRAALNALLIPAAPAEAGNGVARRGAPTG